MVQSRIGTEPYQAGKQLTPLQNRDSIIAAFTRLGNFLRQFPEGTRSSDAAIVALNEEHYSGFSSMLEREHISNPWFTRDAVLLALHGISLMLEEKILRAWLGRYTPVHEGGKSRTVGLVMAGNIPLVGFHDLLCVLITGHSVLAKASSKDDRLIRKIADLIMALEPSLAGRIRFTGEPLKGIDAVIATGSNNSARYFEYYFRDIPHIIRKNRNGVAVLTGNESGSALAGIGKDIFSFFGLGCRNVTKLYIPEKYDLKVLLRVLDSYLPLSQHHKYSNNVEYQRTIYLMNKIPILDNGVLLLKEDTQIASPVGVVFYERYSEIEEVLLQLESLSEQIQCVVSTSSGIPGALGPGTTQEPMPWDYADGVDTIRFLNELS